MTKLNYTLTEIRKDEIEISFDSWDSRYPTIWRLVLKNNVIEVAKPGRCNNFNLSYQWTFRFNVYGYGIKRISSIIEAVLPKQYLPDNPSNTAMVLYNAHIDYINQVAKLLVTVRNMLTN